MLCCNCCILAVFAGNPQTLDPRPSPEFVIRQMCVPGEWQGAACAGASKHGEGRNVIDAVRVSLELAELVSFYKQDDLPSAALFPKRVCFRCIA